MELSFESIATLADSLGVVFLLVLIIASIWRRWFVPYYLVEEMQIRITRAEDDGRYWRDVAMRLMTGTDRIANVAERAAEALSKRDIQ